MASDDKKYSLISVDTGSAEEAAGVRTTHGIVDGEETIVVSSTKAEDISSDAGTISVDSVFLQSDALPTTPSSDERPVSSSAGHLTGAQKTTLPAKEESSGGNEEVPFKRMQTIIIVSLIVVIVLFLVYFNFLR